MFVGYRYYTTKKVQPLYPFGYGLSYTTFGFSNLKLSANKIAPGDGLTVTFDVKNTGRVAGAEVAQLCVSDPSSILPPFDMDFGGSLDYPQNTLND
jgi:beta-glucosidase